MRSISVASLCIALLPAAVVTTSNASSPATLFEHGVADALGFSNIHACYNDTSKGVTDLREAMKLYNEGGIIHKAKAVADFGEGIKAVLAALGPCEALMADASMYIKLVKDLTDPKFYTVHNGLTLILNLAEDHKQLGYFIAGMNAGNYRLAGFEIMTVALNVLSHPGIPSSNGTRALLIAEGIASGFSSSLNFTCLADLTVTVPAVIGGLVDMATVALIIPGLESLFHGLQGIVPAFRACMDIKSELSHIFHVFSDFAHPLELAKQIWSNIKANGLDISLEIADAILAWKGPEWQRVGVDIGTILEKLLVGMPNSTATTIVV